MKAIDYIRQKRAIITADDFAISEGVDQTIIKLMQVGKISRTSVLVTSSRAPSSVKQLLKITKNGIGLHLDFTFGRALSISGSSLLTDNNGNFNRGFGQILLLSLLFPVKMRQLVANEIKAQTIALKKMGANISHIDGHQHIHMIPLIFNC
ncbi:MAG: ChbG/HpnK family deacetylase, partial [Pseudomonadota bacterium]